MRRIGTMAAAASLSMAAAVSTASAGAIERPLMEPPPPMAGPYWTGFYMGVFGGGALRDGTLFSSIISIDHIPPHSWTVEGGSSFLGGLTMGFNWQIGAVLLGVESEIAYVGFETKTVDPFDPTRSLYGSLTYDDWEEFVGARIGVLLGNAVLYGKIGAVFGEYQARVYDIHAPGAPLSMGDGTDVALAGGAGLEYAITRQWSAKIEYLYMNMNPSQPAAGITYDTEGFFIPTGEAWTAEPSGMHSVRIGVNYRFSGWRDEAPFK